MKIFRLTYKEIDLEAYDRCVEKSSFGSVYAMSWYLDAVSPQWEVLMADDYRYVVPLPVKKKFGIRYLTQPYFCQQLGIFSTEEISLSIYNEFIKAIPYSFYHLQLNTGNVFAGRFSELRDNFVLNLNRPYTEIRENYGSNFSKNIKKSKKYNLYTDKKIKFDEFLNLIRSHTSGRPIENLLPIFNHLIQKIQEKVIIEIRGIRDEKDTIQAVALFLRWKNRLYFLLNASTPEGKVTHSMSFLLDNVIQDYAGQDLILDFEGSSIPNIARFYQSTGAVKTSFPVIRAQNGIGKIVKLFR
ncbi:hypothetical protein AGMMS50262_03080 [Bacteroidia bacterium]|nr:hypothetical protein AGMMS50262_03080 [Bacteroidia bacterium]